MFALQKLRKEHTYYKIKYVSYVCLLSMSFPLYNSENHKLPIELGRHRNLPRENRMCTKCDSSLGGDEFHVLFDALHILIVQQNVFQENIFIHSYS